MGKEIGPAAPAMHCSVLTHTTSAPTTTPTTCMQPPMPNGCAPHLAVECSHVSRLLLLAVDRLQRSATLQQQLHQRQPAIACSKYGHSRIESFNCIATRQVTCNSTTTPQQVHQRQMATACSAPHQQDSRVNALQCHTQIRWHATAEPHYSRTGCYYIVDTGCCGAHLPAWLCCMC
jgi:hypothetical protein